MTTGRCEWRSEKGYGMIRDSDGEMVFVPVGLADGLKPGDTVLLRRRKGSKGHVAEELVRLGEPDEQLLKQSHQD